MRMLERVLFKQEVRFCGNITATYLVALLLVISRKMVPPKVLFDLSFQAIFENY